MALLPSNTRKGLGLRFEEGMPTTFGLETLCLGDADEIPAEFVGHELSIPVGGMHDQGATNSCVAHAFGHAIILKEAREGFDYDEPAWLFPYWMSRKEHDAQWFDGGTYLRTMGIALRKFGMPSARYWKWGQFSTRVNRRPNWTAMRKAHPRRGGKYVRIYETGDRRILAIQRALMAGHDVAFGTRLGVSFIPSRGSSRIDLPPVTEAIAGNHAMLIIGWRRFAGVTYFRVLNSWGREWRDRGLCWMSAEYIASSYTKDLHIVHGWERVRT